MKKKKVLALGMVACLAATAIVGGTLAYFTDTDQETNTFAVGNVTIDLIEKQRNKERTELEEFEQGKKLYPIVGSAQGDKDQFGQPVAKNYIDKMVTVENTGTEDAYVRAYFAIPSALDDGYETFNAGLNVLHFNFGNKLVDGTLTTTYGDDWIWKNEDGSWKYFETSIGGIQYNVYYANYADVVAAGETTEQFVSGVYLDKSFDYADGKYYAFGEELILDNGWDWNAVKCPVFAVAVQAAGFDSADAAFDTALGADYNPWAE